MYKKILLAIDNSDNAIRAANRAIEIQKQYNSEIIIFHSIEYTFSEKIELSIIPEITTWGTYVISSYSSEEFQKIKERDGETLLMNIRKLFDKESIPIETRLISDETPEKYINKQIKEEKFDLVIIGCRGHHSKIKTVIFRNVAQNILNNALCDVLIVR